MTPWFQVNPSELRLSWDPSHLSTGEDRETVDIVLVQYQESSNQVEKHGRIINSGGHVSWVGTMKYRQ